MSNSFEVGIYLYAGKSTPVFLPREFHGQRSLGGYSPEGHKELDMTNQLMLSGYLAFGDLKSL